LSKPEVRKAGGVYYTLQWVVDEIVRRTVDPLLANRRPRDLQTFRVLDPACGSGSFLFGGVLAARTFSADSNHTGRLGRPETNCAAVTQTR